MKSHNSNLTWPAAHVVWLPYHLKRYPSKVQNQTLVPRDENLTGSNSEQNFHYQILFVSKERKQAPLYIIRDMCLFLKEEYSHFRSKSLVDKSNPYKIKLQGDAKGGIFF